MLEKDAKKLIRELNDKIFYHKDLYFNQNKTEISDYEFDNLVYQLESLEKRFPHLKEEKSATNSVGASVQKKGLKHNFPMLSLLNTYSREDLQKFYSRVCKLTGQTEIETFCEVKIDGVAVSILYKKGKLTRALTRGDGMYGENIFNNILQIDDIPKNIPMTEDLEIRGEVFISKTKFKELNEKKKKLGEELWANARNLASATIKLLDINTIRKRHPSFIPYSLFIKNDKIKNQSEIIAFLKEWGFFLPNHYMKATNFEEIFSFTKIIEKKRKDFDFESDGLVVKVNSFALQKKIGETNQSPKWAIAYKYKPKSAFSKLKKVVFQVGRTGAVNPIAIFKPVRINGSLIQKASLHNSDYIEKLDLCENDIIEVEKGGEVIPQIINIDKLKREKDFKKVDFPQLCPSCGSTLKKEEKILYCVNHDNCLEQQKSKIKHFVSKEAMDIFSLGEKKIDLLVEKKLISHSKDLYKLNFNSLKNVPGFSTVSIKTILKEIEKSKQKGLEYFLFAQGIKHIGINTAKILAKTFKSIENIKNISKEEFEKVESIGEKVSTGLFNFFQNPKIKNDLLEYKNLNLNMTYKEDDYDDTDNTFFGKIVTISGTFPNITRSQLIQKIEKQGGKIINSISKKVDIFLVGKNPTPHKIEKAKKLEIEMQDYLPDEILSFYET